MNSIFIAATPNSETDDVILAKSLFWDMLMNKKITHNNTLQNSLRFFPQNTLYYNSGRAALVECLKACQINKNDEVIIQALTCVAVPKAIIQIEAKPVYVDIDKNTLNLDLDKIQAKITSKTRAIIVQNTFGIDTDIKKIADIINIENSKRYTSKKIYLISDCAHSLKSNKCIGDLSFYSFGQDKMLSTTQGGAIITDNNNLQIRLQKSYDKLKVVSKSEIRKLLLHIAIWDIVKKFYYFPTFAKSFSLGKAVYQISKILKLTDYIQNSELALESEIHVNQMSEIQKLLLENQLTKLERYNKNREEITKIYESKIDTLYKVKVGIAPLLRFPVIVNDPLKVQKEFKKHQIIIGNWYNSIIYPATIDQGKVGYENDCPNAEYVSKHIINLPTNISVSKDDALRISEIFNKINS